MTKFSLCSHNLNIELVAKGFEESFCDSRIDSPTCLKENLRLVLAICACYSWTLFSLDVKSAFLQGKQIDRALFVKPPAEAHTEYVWELNKALYGNNLLRDLVS